MAHQRWAALRVFHYQGCGPIFVLTVHSKLLPLSLSWEGTPSWLPVVSQELNPCVQDSVKGRSPSSDSFPASCLAEQAGPQVILVWVV